MGLHAFSNPRELWDDMVIKKVDESVSASTTLQNDDELFFTVLAGIPYLFQLILVYAGTAAGSGTADLKHDFALSAGSVNRAWRQHIGFGPTTIVIQAGQVADLSTAIVAAVGGDVLITTQKVDGFVQPSADATLNFRWAQNASDAAAVVVKAGSTVAHRKLLP